MLKKNVLICGATGYIGLQLTKLLCKHKHINIKYLCGSSSVGKRITSYEKSLKSKNLPKITKFNKSFLKEVDLVFTALPNGEAQSISNRLLKHNTNKGAKSTKGYKWELAYKKKFNYKNEALSFEYKLKKDRKERLKIIYEFEQKKT